MPTCAATSGATAYVPVMELLRDCFRIVADDDVRTRPEKVGGKALTLDRTLEDTLPYLLALAWVARR